MIQEHGDGNYIFGWGDEDALAIATATGLVPQTLKLSGAAEYVSKAEDEEGVPAAMAVAPDGRTFTMTGYIVDLIKFKAAASFNFDGKYYVITGRNRDYENKEYVKAEFSGEQHDKITGPVVP